jgi:hypothetical protein
VPTCVVAGTSRLNYGQAGKNERNELSHSCN